MAIAAYARIASVWLNRTLLLSLITTWSLLPGSQGDMAEARSKTKPAPATETVEPPTSAQSVPPAPSPPAADIAAPAQTPPAKPTSSQSSSEPEQAAVARQAEAGAHHAAEIESAKARCKVVLASLTLIAKPHEAIQEGECGALAPVELSSVSANPAVALVPPAIVTCELAVAIHDWVKNDIQPLALQHLGKAIARIETMSSYSCRNAYGRRTSKLSEHGRANALDVGGFVTSDARSAIVLADWGPTAVEIAAATAAAQRARDAEIAATKAQTDRAAAISKAPAPIPAKASSPANPVTDAKTIVDGLPFPPSQTSATQTREPRSTGSGLGLAPAKLGGPERQKGLKGPTPAQIDTPRSPPSQGSAKALFLRAVHDSACRRFETTLGPETNAAHRNHFHIDLAQRRSKPICE